MAKNSIYGIPVGTHLTIEQIRAVQVAQERARVEAAAMAAEAKVKAEADALAKASEDKSKDEK